MQQYFIDKIKDKQVMFTIDQGHHIKNVMHLQLNQQVRVVDSLSQLYLVKLVQLEPAVIGLVEKQLEISEIRPYVRLLATLLKKEKWELMLQKAVEFGVDEIVPLFSERCVIKLKENEYPKKLQRWNKITMEACRQCHRNSLVEVKTPTLLSNIKDYKAEINLIAYEQAAIENHIIDYLLKKPQATINLIIGPEGGFSGGEICAVKESGYDVVSLGNRIMRAESATIYGLNAIDNWFRINK